MLVFYNFGKCFQGQESQGGLGALVTAVRDADRKKQVERSERAPLPFKEVDY